MVPITVKSKKGKGGMVPVSPTKRAKKVGNKRWVSVTAVQDLNVMIDEEVAAQGQGKVAQLMMMMKMLTDLPSRFKANRRQTQRVSPSTSSPERRMARHQMSPDQKPDLSEEVHHRVVKRMKQLPVFTEAMTEGDSTPEEEEQPIT